MLTRTQLFHQTLAQSPVFSAEFVIGIGYGWVAPTLRSLQNAVDNELSLNTVQCSWVASLHEFGRMFGPLLGGFLLDRIGRKGVFVVSMLTFFLQTLPIVFTRSVPVLFLVRAVFGVCVGLCDVNSTIYMGENCHPQLRGTFSSLSIACFYSGQLIEFIVATYLPYGTVAVFNAAITFLALGSLLPSTETAQYLITKGENERALRNFSWLKGVGQPPKESCDEFERLRQQVKEDFDRRWTLSTLVTNPLYRKTVAILLTVCIFVLGTGFAPVNSFASITFTEGVFTPHEFTILFGALGLVSVLISSFVMEKLDRRTILIGSLSIIAFVHMCSAALFYMHRFFSIPYFSWCTFSSITLYSMIYSMGVQPLFFTLRGELLPQSIKGVGSMLTIMMHSLTSFLTAVGFLFVVENFGVEVNFVFFALSSVVAAVFVYFILPETRGRSLAEIQRALQKSSE